MPHEQEVKAFQASRDRLIAAIEKDDKLDDDEAQLLADLEQETAEQFSDLLSKYGYVAGDERED